MPVRRWQRVQWQCATQREGRRASKRTSPHRQRPDALVMAAAGAGAAAALGLVAKAKIGGQTGDILGASQQLSEAAALVAAAA